MTMHWKPVTTIGRWSCALIAASITLFLLAAVIAGTLYANVPSTSGGIMTELEQRPFLPATALAAILCGLVSFLLGLLAIVRSKDHAVLTFVSTALGLLLLIFLAGEFVGTD